MKFDYESIVDTAFQNIGFKPHGDQRDYVMLMLAAVHEEGMTDLILSAPTGTGKSVIGLAFAEGMRLIADIINPGDFSRDPDDPERSVPYSMIMTLTNALSEQYANSFSTIPSVLQVKGKANYPCELQGCTAEDCILKELNKVAKNAEMQGFEPSEMLGEFAGYWQTCRQCEYRKISIRRSKIEHVITNYSVFLINQLHAESKLLGDRHLCIMDEAHSLNEIFTGACSLEFKPALMRSRAERVLEYSQLPGSHLQDLFEAIRIIEKEVITSANAFQVLGMIGSQYELIVQYLDTAIDMEPSPQTAKRISKLRETYQSQLTLLIDFSKTRWEHVIVHENETQGEPIFKIQPIFIGNMYRRVCGNTRVRLMMSATISEDLVKETMAVNPDTTMFIQVPPAFPVESKTVHFYKPLKLNYQTLQDQTMVKRLVDNVAEILAKHPNEKGLIITPSFKLSKAIVDGLKMKSHVVFEHTSGQKLPELVSRFKMQSRPSVLISPSVHTGHDFADDSSRFQIIVKCQYPSLGDRRMKYIADHHPNIYQLSAIMTMVQSGGRGTRHKNDWSKTYILDSNAESLWKSRLNVWRCEFKEED
jgi:Rad3-related DNA helicase